MKRCHTREVTSAARGSPSGVALGAAVTCCAVIGADLIIEDYADACWEKSLSVEACFTFELPTLRSDLAECTFSFFSVVFFIKQSAHTVMSVIFSFLIGAA